MSGIEYAEYLFLERILSGAFDEEAGGRWLPAEEMHERFNAAMRDSFVEYGYEIGSRYQAVTDQHLTNLVSAGTLSVEGDEFTGKYYRFDVRSKDAYVRDQINGLRVAKTITRLGASALDRALKNLAPIEGWTNIAISNFDARDAGVLEDGTPQIPDTVPASDRIVTRSDNLPPLNEASVEIGNLREDLRTGNEAGDKIGDEREIVDLELEIADEIIKRPRFRVQSLLNLLWPALRFLVDKFAGGAIGEAAKRLMSLLLGLL